MIISAVVAVVLGAAPVQAGSTGAIYAAGQKMSDLVRDYRQSTDRRGTTHVEGHDLKGRPFELIIDRKGYVEASVGEWDIAFHAADAG